MKKNKVALIGAGIIAGITGITSLVIKNKTKRKAEEFVGEYQCDSTTISIPANFKNDLGTVETDSVVVKCIFFYNASSGTVSVRGKNKEFFATITKGVAEDTLVVKEIKLLGLEVLDEMTFTRQGVK